MADVQALEMDVVTEKSGHNVVGMAVSVCLTPAAPAPLPIPYPLTASVAEGITDSPLRTKVSGTNCATIGSVLKTCHGNEPGSLKEVVSLNQMGPVAPITGAFTVLIELGPAAFTGSIADMNKAPTPGVGSNASDAGGAGGGGGGGAGGPGAGGGPGGPNGPAGGGGGGGGSGDGAAGTSESPQSEHTCQGGHPVDLVSGAVVDMATDLEIPGLIPLVFKRYYSSSRHEDVESSLGPGWGHSFDQRIVPRDKSMALRDGEGRSIYFEKVGVGQSSFHRRERLTLTRSDELEFRVYAHEARLTSVFAPVRLDGPAVIRRIEDNYGNAIVFEYRKDRLARVVDTARRAVNVAWRGELIASLTVAAGGSGCVVSYEYARNGCLAVVRNPLGHVEKYRYDTLRRMVSTTTLSGAEFAYEYDADSPRCVASYGPEGLFELHLERDEEKHTTYVDSEEPRVVVWNDKGLAERLLLPDGTVLDEAAYDDDGLLIAKANGASEGWKYWYDERGRRVRIMDPGQRVSTYEYDGDRLTRIIGPDGHATRFAYDDKGSCTAAEYPSGERYFIRYDQRGRLAEVTGNTGRLVAFEYDDENNPVAETDARGARTTYRYDGMGRPIARRDALDRQIQVTRDALGRRTSLRFPDGATTSFAYDAAGHLARAVDPLGRATLYGYGGLHALKQVTGPDGQKWNIEYTGEERVKRIVNPLGEAYSFERDLAGRVVSETSFDGRVLHYERDGAGRVACLSQPDGTSRTFGYDRTGQLAIDKTSEDSITFRRDEQGRLLAALVEGPGIRHETRFERDPFGRVVAEIEGDRRVSYEVDAAGSRTSRVLPNGVVTRYGYDGAGALQHVDHDGFRLDIARDAVGRETARSTATGLSISRAYDAVDQLVGQRAVFGNDGSVPRTLAERRYSYDSAGRIARIDDARWGATTYQYDVLDHLVEAKRGPYREAFSYDTCGSIVAALEELDGRPHEAKTELGPGGLLLSAGDTKYENDARGRRVRAVDVSQADAPKTTQYEWDARDRLRSAALPDGTRVTLSYDALGRRVRKEVTPSVGGSSRTTDYVWDGGALAMQLDSVEGARVFVHAPSSFVPLLQQERGEVFTYVLDHMATPKELLTPDGLVAWSAAHTAWGHVVAEHADASAVARYGRAIKSPFRLLGQIADDELGLCFTRYRMFDPGVGRFLSADPLGLGGGSNVFAFNGAPTVSVDPLGLNPTAAAGGGPHPIPDTTFRRDNRDPATIHKDGFQPRGTNTDLHEYAEKNVPSVYVGTTVDKNVAAKNGFCGTGGDAYVYTVHPTNGVDVNASLGKTSPFPNEREIAVPGGIPTKNIEGAQKINPDGSLGPMIPNPNYVPK